MWYSNDKVLFQGRHVCFFGRHQKAHGSVSEKKEESERHATYS